MRKSIVFLFVFCLGSLCGSSAFAQKLGYVDFEFIVESLNATKDVQKQLQSLADDWEKQLELMQDTLGDMSQDFENLSIAVSQKTREGLKKNIQDMQFKIYQFQEQKFSPASGEIYIKQNELMQPLIDKVRKIVEEVRLDLTYVAIFDVSLGGIVAFDKTQDLTDQVLDRLNEQGLTSGGVKELGTGKDGDEKAGTGPSEKNSGKKDSGKDGEKK